MKHKAETLLLTSWNFHLEMSGPVRQITLGITGLPEKNYEYKKRAIGNSGA